MAKILVIETYLSKENSIADYAMEKFVEEYKKINPNDEFIYLDLNKEKKLQQVLSANNFDNFWNEESNKYFELVSKADKIIISTGMINFTVSTLLKNFLDNILVAQKAFRYKYDGSGLSEGLLNNKIKVQLLLAQGAPIGWYQFAQFDKYLESVFNFIGINDIQTIIYDGTKTKEQAALTIEEKFNLKIDQFNKHVKLF